MFYDIGAQNGGPNLTADKLLSLLLTTLAAFIDETLLALVVNL
jgi:hypothetical protein